MKIFRSVLLALCLISLSACACPRTPPYTGTPYDPERTAGTGMREDDGWCLGR